MTVPDREYLKKSVDDESFGAISRVECTVNNGSVAMDRIFDAYGKLLNDDHEHYCEISMMVAKYIKCYESLPVIMTHASGTGCRTRRNARFAGLLASLPLRMLFTRLDAI
ncbi:hypothetical protein Tco_1452134 [Tanacetum coccineum]